MMTDRGSTIGQTDIELGRSPGLADWSTEDSGSEGGANPIKMVIDALRGRWLWALLLSLILAPLSALTGWYLGPIKYSSTGVLSINSRLPSLVEGTPETEAMPGFDTFVGEQIQYLKSPRVLTAAFKDSRIQRYVAEDSSLPTNIATRLSVNKPRGLSLIMVGYESDDSQRSKAVVNSIIDAYISIYQPSNEVSFGEKTRKIRDLSTAASDEIERLERTKLQKLQGSRYGMTNTEAIINENVFAMRALEVQIEALEANREEIRRDVVEQARAKAQAEGLEFVASDVVPDRNSLRTPNDSDLLEIDPGLRDLKNLVRSVELQLAGLRERFGAKHRSFRQLNSALEAKKVELDSRTSIAVATWEEERGEENRWGALGDRLADLREERQSLRDQVDNLHDERIKVTAIDRQIEELSRELATLNLRLQGLERERDSIKQGRVEIAQYGEAAMIPSSNKKSQAAIAGAAAGFGIPFLGLFLLGTLDKKTFGVAQLEDAGNTMRVLGVMPNMDADDGQTETVSMATDCVHRIRGRIEARRSPERGYAMMVSSPFQGDGKTTLAVSLGWSYAESGYKTLLIDADFIGRAMSHQFGHLRNPGLREIIRNGKVADEIQELGHPNLCLLSVGFDRRVSAANLSPRLMSRVLEAVREEFDVILIDSGPLTASIEAMPVASAVDGVVLALRRGRSRARVAECVSDIRAVGADYLGVVLNYADKSDCLRYGSTSRMSVSVAAALESADEDNPELGGSRNPLLEEIQRTDR